MTGNPLAATSRNAIGLVTMRKVAWRLVPFMMFCYFINYVDRVNVGYAALRMNADLGLSATAYGFGAGMFFIGYFFFEVPSNLILHRVGARRWIARIMVSWGVIATAMALATGPISFYVLRFLLGVAEAGFFPGMLLYLTYWFPRKNRAWIMSLFFASVPLSSVLGAPLSTLIMEKVRIGSLKSWQVLFIVEGIPAIVVGFLVLFLLTDRPAQAKWLDPAQRDWLVAELAKEKRETESRHRYTVREALLNPRVLALSFVYFGVVYGIYALGFFLPQIISAFQAEFGVKYGLIQIGLITAIPYAVATVAMLAWSRHSDRTGERSNHVAIAIVLGALAIAVSLYLGSPLLIMVGISIAAAGIFSAVPTFWQMPTMFLAGAAAAGGLGLINSMGNLAGFLGPYVTGWLRDLTGDFRAGLLAVSGMMLAAALVARLLGQAPRPNADAAQPTTATTLPAPPVT